MAKVKRKKFFGESCWRDEDFLTPTTMAEAKGSSSVQSWKEELQGDLHSENLTLSPKASADTVAWYLIPRISNPMVEKLRLSGQQQDKTRGNHTEASHTSTG